MKIYDDEYLTCNKFTVLEMLGVFNEGKHQEQKVECSTQYCSESQHVGVGGTGFLFWLQSEPCSSLIQLLPVHTDQWRDCNLFSRFLGTGTVADWAQSKLYYHDVLRVFFLISMNCDVFVPYLYL